MIVFSHRRPGNVSLDFDLAIEALRPGDWLDHAAAKVRCSSKKAGLQARNVTKGKAPHTWPSPDSMRWVLGIAFHPCFA